jgi:hypothetical protein
MAKLESCIFQIEVWGLPLQLLASCSGDKYYEQCAVRHVVIAGHKVEKKN